MALAGMRLQLTYTCSECKKENREEDKQSQNYEVRKHRANCFITSRPARCLLLFCSHFCQQ
ncbi:hypothetical protein LX36DRAFT_1163 [Colletotrichum falcatum]|nr:hypothetical protein LX36DRAFT_1163 [Colletotrichum falcatum]